MASVEVFVEAARKLRNVQTIGTQDPFVKLTVGNSSRNTRTANNGGSGGVFKQSFSFRYSGQKALQVQVFNDNAMSNTLIGQVNIPLRDAVINRAYDRWFDIYTKSQKLAGQVKLRFTKVVEGLEDDKAAAGKAILNAAMAGGTVNAGIKSGGGSGATLVSDDKTLLASDATLVSDDKSSATLVNAAAASSAVAAVANTVARPVVAAVAPAAQPVVSQPVAPATAVPVAVSNPGGVSSHAVQAYPPASVPSARPAVPVAPMVQAAAPQQPSASGGILAGALTGAGRVAQPNTVSFAAQQQQAYQQQMAYHQQQQQQQMYQQQMVYAQQQVQQRPVIAVRVPYGCVAGQSLIINANGRNMQVQIPYGVAAGQVFHVQT